MRVDCDKFKLHTGNPNTASIITQQRAIAYKPKRRYNGTIKIFHSKVDKKEEGEMEQRIDETNRTQIGR